MHSFWKMVKQNNVKKIVTLCQIIGEGHHADAYQYFPVKEGEKITLANGMVVESTKVTDSEH
jgi:protein tyrosine phosphatase